MATNQFMVFGYDVRDYGRLWLAAWRDFLFGDDSPIRSALDSVVPVQMEDGSIQRFQAGRAVDTAPEIADGTNVATAIALPDDLVLARTLTLPTIAEADLEAALSLEVAASSPFAPDDTVAGWRVVPSAEGKALTVEMVLTSRAAVMGFLSEKYSIHDPMEREVWGRSEHGWVVVKGFGEHARESEYRKRLIKSSVLLVCAMCAILAIAGGLAFFSSVKLSRLESLRETVQAEARDAVKLRDELATVNETIRMLNMLRGELPSPQLEIARLTQLLPDSAYITQYTQNGRKIRLRGRGSDAAALQQNLTEESVFTSVTAPQAISRVGSSGLEQFFLDVELKVQRQ